MHSIRLPNFDAILYCRIAEILPNASAALLSKGPGRQMRYLKDQGVKKIAKVLSIFPGYLDRDIGTYHIPPFLTLYLGAIPQSYNHCMYCMYKCTKCEHALSKCTHVCIRIFLSLFKVQMLQALRTRRSAFFGTRWG